MAVVAVLSAKTLLTFESRRKFVGYKWPAGSWLSADRAADAGNDKADSTAVRPPPPPRNRGSYCQAAVRGHHPAHYAQTLRPWAPWRRLVVRGAHPPSLPARLPALRRACACGCVVLACAWACCRGAVQRRACTGATGRVPFLCVVLAHLRCGRVEQPREARGARRCWRLDGCVMQLSRV